MFLRTSIICCPFAPIFIQYLPRLFAMILGFVEIFPNFPTLKKCEEFFPRNFSLDCIVWNWSYPGDPGRFLYLSKALYLGETSCFGD